MATLAWRGTAYAGWQLQPNATTIQGTVEAALAAMKSELEAAKGEIETLHADSSLADLVGPFFHRSDNFKCTT